MINQLSQKLQYKGKTDIHIILVICTITTIVCSARSALPQTSFLIILIIIIFISFKESQKASPKDDNWIVDIYVWDESGFTLSGEEKLWMLWTLKKLHFVWKTELYWPHFCTFVLCTFKTYCCTALWLFVFEKPKLECCPGGVWPFWATNGGQPSDQSSEKEVTVYLNLEERR